LAAAGEAIVLSSMCTVFAESEVVSLIGRGEDSRRVALGIHQAIARRVSAMVKRLGAQPRLVFAGGVAQNECMVKLFTKELGITPTIPNNPQIVGALGAAIHATDILC
jgi:activator of 2-hydroxyglutaryl-CoA dehydratase